MVEMMIRKVLGTIIAFSATIPWLWKSYYVLHLLAIDGLNSSIGIGPDMAIVLSFGLVFIFTSVFLIVCSRALLKIWCKPVLYVLLGVVLVTFIQDITIYILTDNLQDCGKINCNSAERLKPSTPEIITLK